MAPSEAIRRRCAEQWVTAFNGGPHTSFKMVEVLMRVLNVDSRQLLRDPAILTRFDPRYVTVDELHDTYFETWGKSTGRCTSFAIRVACNLENEFPEDVFQFQYYNLGTHRVARCSKTEIVIDCESKRGLEILRNNEEWVSTPNFERGQWKYHNNYSIFEEDKPDVPREQRRIYPITAEMALAKCLDEIAKKAILVCCFRSITNQGQSLTKPEYHGVIRWRLAEHRIELIADINNKDQISTITFGRGNQETHRDCVLNLVAFIKACGIKDQWKADGIDRFNNQLWKAAIMEWGYPVWESNS